MTIKLYDLVGKDDRRFSPHCWRTRMALAHKRLDHETRPTRFTGIGKLGDGECRTVPVIEDGSRRIVDSWEIAQYLEQTYPEAPSLFGGAGGAVLTGFVQSWTTSVLHPGVVGLILSDIHEHLMPEDQDYFRTTREQRFGRPLEEVQAGREARVATFRQSLQPLRLTLQSQAFLGGERPLYADYLVFGAFQWARSVSPFRLLADDDPIHAWMGRCLDLHGGIARSVPAYYG